MKRADQLAKLGCKKSTPSTFTFSSLSHTLSQINEINPLRRWKEHIDKNPIKETSSFYRPSFILHPHLKVPKWFKPISRPITSRLNQAITGHGYIQAITGHGYIQSYFERFNIPCQAQCDCSSEANIPPVSQTREHIFKACVHHEPARSELRKHATRIDDPRWHSSKLFMEKFRKPLVQFFQDSGAFSRKHSLATSERSPQQPRRKHHRKEDHTTKAKRQAHQKQSRRTNGSSPKDHTGQIGTSRRNESDQPAQNANIASLYSTSQSIDQPKDPTSCR